MLTDSQLNEWLAYRHLEPNYGSASGLFGGSPAPEKKQTPEQQEKIFRLWATALGGKPKGS